MLFNKNFGRQRDRNLLCCCLLLLPRHQTSTQLYSMCSAAGCPYPHLPSHPPAQPLLPGLQCCSSVAGFPPAPTQSLHSVLPPSLPLPCPIPTPLAAPAPLPAPALSITPLPPPLFPLSTCPSSTCPIPTPLSPPHQPPVYAVHLCEQLVDEALRRRVVVAAAPGGQRIHLVKEQHAGVRGTGTGKQLANSTLTLTHILVQQLGALQKGEDRAGGGAVGFEQGAGLSLKDLGLQRHEKRTTSWGQQHQQQTLLQCIPRTAQHTHSHTNWQVERQAV